MTAGLSKSQRFEYKCYLSLNERMFTHFSVSPLHGCQGGYQIGADWHQMGQIWDIQKKIPDNMVSQSVLKLILKSLIFVPFGAKLSLFGVNPDIPEAETQKSG